MRGRVGATVAAVAVVFAVVVVTLSGGPGGEREGAVFHATLADPGLYVDGVYSRDIELEPGRYGFEFTPNGDSPQTLSIRVAGGSVSFEEDFELRGTLHETGISRYHTWEYLAGGEGGGGVIDVAEPAGVRITVNPNGNLLGPVSVSLLRL